MRHVLIVLALLVPLAPLAAGDEDVLVSFEASEPARNDLDAAGQKNCVAEAILAETSTGCARSDTKLVYPASGVLVLDNFVSGVGVRDPERTRGEIESGNTMFWNGALGNMNTRRATRDALPDVILPGHQAFEAWFGWWDDLNVDGNIQLRQVGSFGWAATNEWAPKNDAIVVSYIEPGSHPMTTSQARPDEGTPDLRYFDGGTRYILSDSVVFVDGSLFQKYRVTTVADALLAPDTEGRPFTSRADSRIDIDDYGAVAAGPIETLYGMTLAPAVNAVGSPGYSTCPSSCRPSPVETSGLPEGERLAKAQGSVWARHPHEWEPGSGNTAAGRLDVHRDRYAGWIDLLALTAFPSTSAYPRAGPLVGGESGGRQTVAPGYLTFEARVGIWKDLSKDGVVGVAAGNDPYRGGTRPIPDDYDNPAGEFVGVAGRQGTDAAWEMVFISVTLTPETEWGPGGIWATRQGQPTCSPTRLPCLPTTGKTPLTLDLGRDAATYGLYWAVESVLMPTGSVPFEACTETVLVRHDANGEREIEAVLDCDRFDAWQVPTIEP